MAGGKRGRCGGGAPGGTAGPPRPARSPPPRTETTPPRLCPPGTTGSFGHRYLDCEPDVVEEAAAAEELWDDPGLAGDPLVATSEGQGVLPRPAGVAAAMAEGRRLQGAGLPPGASLPALSERGGITLPAPSDLLHAWDERSVSVLDSLTGKT